MPGWVPGASGTSGTALGPALQARSEDRKGKAQKELPLLVPSMVPPQLETLGVGVTCPCWWTAELGQPSRSVWAPREAVGVALPWHLSPGTVPSPALPAAATAVEYAQVSATSARLRHAKATRTNSQ